jgi:hypothetical protein
VRCSRQPLIWINLVVALAGCDQLFGLDVVTAPPPDAPVPTTSLVQQTARGADDQHSLDVTLDALPTSGNVLVMVGGTERDRILTPVGGGVASWMQAARSLTYQNIEIWYGITDGSSSTVTITCACASTALGQVKMSLGEWDGLITTNLFEVGEALAGTTTGPGVASTDAIVTLAAPDLLIFGVATLGTIGPDVIGTDGRWTAFDPIAVNEMNQSQWYQVVAGPGTYMPGAMVIGDWDAAVVAFRARRSPDGG